MHTHLPSTLISIENILPRLTSEDIPKNDMTYLKIVDTARYVRENSQYWLALPDYNRIVLLRAERFFLANSLHFRMDILMVFLSPVFLENRKNVRLVLMLA